MIQLKSKVLIRNRIFFYYIEKKIRKQIKKDIYNPEIIENVSRLASFAWLNHAGIFYNQTLENFLIQIGNKLKYKRQEIDELLFKDIEEYTSRKKSPIIFHIVSEFQDVGGHSRVQLQMIKRMPEGYNQILIVLNQDIDKIPIFINDISIEKIKIISLNNYSNSISKAFILREITKNVSYIFLNHHPNDIVPNIAYSVEMDCPILNHNHAHSWFWLGNNISDVLLSYSDFHKTYNETRRASRFHFLLDATEIENVKSIITVTEKKTAKQILGLQQEYITLLSVGTVEKFIPNETYNFFEVLEKILNKYANIEIRIVGISNDYKYIIPSLLENQRIKFCGPILDISKYYLASDIYIEAMPLPSLGVGIYSIMDGNVCPLYKYGKRGIYSSYNFIESECYFKYLKEAKNIHEYFENLDILIKNKTIREEIVQGLRKKLISLYDGKAFTKSIEELLQFSKEIKHKVSLKEMPKHQIDEYDIEIAEGSRYKSMREVFDHFKYDLNLLDKMKLTVYCLFYGIHINENKNFSLSIRLEIKKQHNEIKVENPLWDSIKTVIKNYFHA